MTPRTASMSMTSRGIRIGIATVPRQRIEITQDAERLQAVLLSKPHSKDFLPGVVLALCAVGLVIMALAGWLP